MGQFIRCFLLLFSLSLISLSGYTQNLKINELVARNANGLVDEFGDDDDWIEIYNPGSTAINLAGLYIADTNATTLFYRIPSSDASKTTVSAGGYLILWADGEPAEGANHLTFKLSNGGEGVYLGQLSGGTIVLIDQVEYPKLERDVSYGRLPNGTGNFYILSDASPNAANLPIRQVGGILINEIMAINNGSDRDESNEAEDWIEFYNPTSQAIDLGGLYLTDSLGELTMHRIPTTSPDSTTVQPGAYLRFWADGEPKTSILHIDFKLGGTGEKITLVQPDGNTIMQQVQYPALSSDATFGQYPDGSGNWVYLNLPSPKASNHYTYTSVDGILINEIMADNESTYADNVGEIEDWIELYNSNSFPVNVGGLLITDSLENKMTYRIPNTSPDSTTIPAKGYLVFWADNDPEQGVLHLDIKLSGMGEDIGLFQLRTSIYEIDSYVFGAQSPNVTIGRSPDGSENWTILNAPTPGSSNSGEVSGKITGLLINELVARNTTGYQDEHGNIDDWIELYNSTNEAINIGGLYLSDNLSDPGKVQIPSTSPNATTIPAKGYLIVWADAKPELGLLHVIFQLAGSGESLGLYQSWNSQLIILDTVTYPSLENNVSYGRSPNASSTWIKHTSPTPLESNGGNSILDHLYGTESDLVIFPNPLHDNLNIRFIEVKAGQLKWELINTEGRVISARDFSYHSGLNEIILESDAGFQNLKPGLYFLRFYFADKIIHKKIQKQ